MRKLLIVAALAALAVPVHAQTFEALGNPIVVMGGTYQTAAPAVGNRAAFMLSANVAGVKIGSLPVYVGGVGVALPATVASISSQFGDFVMLTVPGVTWFPSGNDPGTLGKICLQAGYAYVLNGETHDRSGVYVAVGFGWDSPAYLKYKRAVKRMNKAKALGKALQGPPPPPNPYDVE